MRDMCSTCDSNAENDCSRDCAGVGGGSADAGAEDAGDARTTPRAGLAATHLRNDDHVFGIDENGDVLHMYQSNNRRN